MRAIVSVRAVAAVRFRGTTTTKRRLTLSIEPWKAAELGITTCTARGGEGGVAGVDDKWVARYDDTATGALEQLVKSSSLLLKAQHLRAFVPGSNCRRLARPQLPDQHTYSQSQPNKPAPSTYSSSMQCKTRHQHVSTAWQRSIPAF
jgi:hypothetical protein